LIQLPHLNPPSWVVPNLYCVWICNFAWITFMANTVSFGVIGFTGSQPKPAISAPNPTIVHSTVVGRRSFGSLKSMPSREVSHLVTRRRSSAAWPNQIPQLSLGFLSGVHHLLMDTRKPYLGRFEWSYISPPPLALKPVCLPVIGIHSTVQKQSVGLWKSWKLQKPCVSMALATQLNSWHAITHYLSFKRSLRKWPNWFVPSDLTPLLTEGFFQVVPYIYLYYVKQHQLQRCPFHW